MSDSEARGGRGARELLKWAAIVLLPFVLYFGGYYAMVRPMTFIGYSFFPEPVYRYDESLPTLTLPSNERWKKFYAPAHWIDRKLRPHVWRLNSE